MNEIFFLFSRFYFTNFLGQIVRTIVDCEAVKRAAENGIYLTLLIAIGEVSTHSGFQI